MARLAAGFGIGGVTAWRYVREATDLPAHAANKLSIAMARIRRLALPVPKPEPPAACPL
jgi:hypothetical protein